MSGRSTCPECGTILRIRDRSFVDRIVKCPECHRKLRVTATDQDHVFAFESVPSKSPVLTDVDAGVTGRKKARAASGPARASLSVPRRTSLNRWLNSPLTAVFLVLIAIASLAAVLVLNTKLRITSPSPPVVTAVSDAPADESQFPAPEQFVAPTSVELPTAVANEPLPATEIEAVESISALEPANLDAPLIWPPAPIVAEVVVQSEPPAEPVPVKIDVESKFAQKILLYKQPKISRRILLDALQEQLGIPIRYNEEDLGVDKLDEKVAFELENTTLGAVLRAVTDVKGWRIVIEDSGISVQHAE